MKEFLEDIHARISPKKDSSIQPFIQKIKKTFKESKHKPEIHVGGSYAKNTHIGTDYDVDIFIKYDSKYRKNPISDYTETVLKTLDQDIQRVHGSRDYFNIIHKERTYELIPVLNIEKPSQAETVVDNSPLHVAYTKKHLTPTKAKHIRLLKQFLKAQRIYGAESYIGGFSGHITDLLILHYNTLPNLLRATQDWTPKTIIDLENHHSLPQHTLNESKTHGPLIIVDPIQKHRNAAAAVTQKTYDALKKKAKELLENPSKQYFTIPTQQDIKKTFYKTHNNPCTIRLTFSDAKKGISGAKLIKIKKHIQRQLQHTGFTQIKTDYHHSDQQSHIYISAEYNEGQLIQGPPLNAPKKHVEAFKQKYENIETKDGNLQATKKTKYNSLKDALQHILKQEYVEERSENT